MCGQDLNGDDPTEVVFRAFLHKEAHCIQHSHPEEPLRMAFFLSITSRR